MTYQDVTVVFIPGAWHSPNGYDGVISHLHKAGYKTAKVWTPSVLRNGAVPVTSIDPDVAEVKKIVSQEVDQGQKVIVVMHSYAGQPGSMAVEGLDQASMTEQGHTDGRGVVHLVYLCAFMLRLGESLMKRNSALEPGPPPDWQEPREDGTLITTKPAHTFYHDFTSEAEIDRWIADLNPWSAAVCMAPLTYEPWRRIPTTFLSCELDRAIPVEWQKEFVRNAIEAGAIDLRAINWKCGHTPFGVRPLEVSQIIRSAIGDVDQARPRAVDIKAKQIVGTPDVVSVTA